VDLKLKYYTINKPNTLNENKTTNLLYEMTKKIVNVRDPITINDPILLAQSYFFKEIIEEDADDVGPFNY